MERLAASQNFETERGLTMHDNDNARFPTRKGGGRERKWTRRGSRWNAKAALLSAIVLFGAGLGLAVSSAANATPTNGGGSVTICHATSSAQNPYVTETVDASSLTGSGHGNSGVNPGDIVPPTPNTDYPNGNNWGTIPGLSATGEQIWNNGCNIPTDQTSSSSSSTSASATESSSASETESSSASATESSSAPATGTTTATQPNQGTGTGTATCNSEGTYSVAATAQGLVGANNNPQGYYQGGVFVTNGVNTVYSQSQTNANGDATFPPFTFDAKGQNSVVFYINSTTTSGGVNVAFTVDFAKCVLPTKGTTSAAPTPSHSKSKSPVPVVSSSIAPATSIGPSPTTGGPAVNNGYTAPPSAAAHTGQSKSLALELLLLAVGAVGMVASTSGRRIKALASGVTGKIFGRRRH